MVRNGTTKVISTALQYEKATPLKLKINEHTYTGDNFVEILNSHSYSFQADEIPDEMLHNRNILNTIKDELENLEYNLKILKDTLLLVEGKKQGKDAKVTLIKSEVEGTPRVQALNERIFDLRRYERRLETRIYFLKLKFERAMQQEGKKE